MTIQSTTLRPGLLVSLKTSLTGNVIYRKKILDAEKIKDGASIARWETEREIADAAEHEEAKRARTKAGSTIRSVCAQSAFGLLCPEADAAELEKAITEARQIADDFNAGAQLSRISLYVITGRIAPDDVEAVRAINSEVRELIDAMAEGIEKIDVKAVREAASRAKALGSMLNPEAEARIRIAIETARDAARAIVKAGEQAAVEIDKRAIRKITEQRTAFLDFDDAGAISAPAAQARALDLAPAAPIAKPAAKAPAFEME